MGSSQLSVTPHPGFGELTCWWGGRCSCCVGASRDAGSGTASLYPLTPLLFCPTCSCMLRKHCLHRLCALVGLFVLVAGLPILLLQRWKDGSDVPDDAATPVATAANPPYQPS
jgi:hypothetical protein